MKIALCFIISYEHILNKEEIWKEWIQPNKDIINVYFYYKDYNKIKSQWIIDHTIPHNFIHETTYFHVIPAYISILNYALSQDKSNQWFCLLTDSCCPIISPRKFRYLFYENYNKSIMSWRNAWWNINYHKRSNLAQLPKEYHLGNDPWFVLKRENVNHVIKFMNKNQELTKLICSGGLANESLFAIILSVCKQLEPNGPVISAVTHLTDWDRMSSFTSPHLFKDANQIDIKFIDNGLDKNKYAMFIRKIAPEFPDNVLKNYIYFKNKTSDDNLIIFKPIYFIYNDFKIKFNIVATYLGIILLSYMLYYYIV
jgi:hypothetical protein